MATIGLSDMFYSKITEGANGSETYGTPTRLAKAIQANLSIEIAQAMLFADDAAQENVREFQSGTLSLGVDDISPEVAAVLLGSSIDENGVLVSSSEDVGPPVAVGFRARRANGKHRYFWLYRVLFGAPSTTLQTKGESITFNTPTIEGTIMRRNKPDSRNRHPWKAEAEEGRTGVAASTISGWFTAVYDPDFPAGTTGTSGTSGVSGVSATTETAKNTAKTTPATENK
jgi:phi13 family phage major tail protein